MQDPKLAEHLAWWGIDIMKLEKTDKTMAELEVRESVCGITVRPFENAQGAKQN